MPDREALAWLKRLRFGFDLVELSDVLKCILRDLALVGRVQIVELATRVRHATKLGHAPGKQRLIACEVVADELALPVPQEGPRMLTRATLGEVVDDRLQVLEGPGAVRP
ncbi:hypothetical protein LMG28138_06116 [Pararobbsia alpina]|uniref:Uncharacterized protein n=1 Tax=Pararobbsia alpina TaxID=621374 RepID=A0A6S7BZI8_9BURK|nr:hypothetical protein LMG28138_06116 [Pararobbsia alpina]